MAAYGCVGPWDVMLLSGEKCSGGKFVHQTVTHRHTLGAFEINTLHPNAT
jgi:hypothetical protein